MNERLVSGPVIERRGLTLIPVVRLVTEIGGAGAWGSVTPLALVLLRDGEARAWWVDGGLVAMERLEAEVPGLAALIRGRRGGESAGP